MSAPELASVALQSSKVWAAAAAVALPLSIVGYSVARLFMTLIEAIARNPAARDKLFPIGILGFALTEALALFAILIAFIILFT